MHSLYWNTCVNIETVYLNGFLKISKVKYARKEYGFSVTHTLHEKCPYSELFWSLFSCIRTEYGKILLISLYLVRMWENMDQNNTEYGSYLHSVNIPV